MNSVHFYNSSGRVRQGTVGSVQEITNAFGEDVFQIVVDFPEGNSGVFDISKLVCMAVPVVGEQIVVNTYTGKEGEGHEFYLPGPKCYVEDPAIHEYSENIAGPSSKRQYEFLKKTNRARESFWSFFIPGLNKGHRSTGSKNPLSITLLIPFIGLGLSIFLVAYLFGSPKNHGVFYNIAIVLGVILMGIGIVIGAIGLAYYFLVAPVISLVGFHIPLLRWFTMKHSSVIKDFYRKTGVITGHEHNRSQTVSGQMTHIAQHNQALGTGVRYLYWIRLGTGNEDVCVFVENLFVPMPSPDIGMDISVQGTWNAGVLKARRLSFANVDFKAKSWGIG